MPDIDQFQTLKHIDSPTDLRQLSTDQLPELCAELREFLIQSVAETGGHLGASLGTVELTAALHYVYQTPDDLLVWDVGHQTYPHKILTGRRDRMNTMRKRGGLAGFPSRQESEYDTFGVGHSSTSISASIGMALGKNMGLDSENRDDNNAAKVVAVIGDGALTAGLAYEALNHGGTCARDLLVILNDNDMSISPNVGAMNKYLARILTGKIYAGAREGSKKVLSKVPPILEFARRTEEHVKGMVVPCTLFEELGFNYFGPVDGHDVESLVDILTNLRELNGPQFLHVVTKKGKGYPFAEQDALALHAVNPFNPQTGKPIKTVKAGAKPKPTYTQVFSQWLCDQAQQDQRLVGITPAMREGSGLIEFEKQFPERYFDVGIAEQHAVTLAAGMACVGKKPVVAIYSTFLQRAYDQLVHDVAIQNLPVLFAIDRAGLVGPDGATHAGSFDFSFMRCLPNMVVMAPADENECRQMLHTGFQLDGPSSVRYPRGSGPGVPISEQLTAIDVGKAEVRCKGENIALLAFGSMVEPAHKIGLELGLSVVNMRFVKPLDMETLKKMAQTHDLLITLEENAVAGGAGSAVLEALSAAGIHTPVKIMGLPDEFVEHGSREELLSYCKLDEAGLRTRLSEIQSGWDRVQESQQQKVLRVR